MKRKFKDEANDMSGLTSLILGAIIGWLLFMGGLAKILGYVAIIVEKILSVETKNIIVASTIMIINIKIYKFKLNRLQGNTGTRSKEEGTKNSYYSLNDEDWEDETLRQIRERNESYNNYNSGSWDDGYINKGSYRVRDRRKR